MFNTRAVNSWILFVLAAQLGFPLISAVAKNLALRGNAKQSSTFYWDGVSSVAVNAIDGDKSGDFKKGGCSHTDRGDKKPNLDLTFEKPVTVKKVILYNRLDGNSSDILSRLQGFILRGFSGNNRQLFKFIDTNPVPQPVYTVKLGKPVSGVAKVNVEATKKDRKGLMFLTLCELEVFGE